MLNAGHATAGGSIPCALACRQFALLPCPSSQAMDYEPRRWIYRVTQTQKIHSLVHLAMLLAVRDPKPEDKRRRMLLLWVHTVFSVGYMAPTTVLLIQRVDVLIRVTRKRKARCLIAVDTRRDAVRGRRRYPCVPFIISRAAAECLWTQILAVSGEFKRRCRAAQLSLGLPLRTLLSTVS